MLGPNARGIAKTFPHKLSLRGSDCVDVHEHVIEEVAFYSQIVVLT